MNLICPPVPLHNPLHLLGLSPSGSSSTYRHCFRSPSTSLVALAITSFLSPSSAPGGTIYLAEHKQPRADEGKQRLGLDHPGQNKNERPKRNDHKMRRKESRRPGLEHLGRNKQQGPPPPRLEHLRSSGGQTPRTGKSGTEQGAGAAAPRTGASEDKRQPIATDENVGNGELEKRPRGQGSGDTAKRRGGRGRGEAEKPR